MLEHNPARGKATTWKPARAPFIALLDAITHEVQPAYVVGGVVRDVLLQRDEAVVDLDLVVAHSAIPVARRVADRLGWAFYALDEGRDVARLVFNAGADPLVCDIASLRGGTIELDLRSRDFTVNALAFAIEPGITKGFPVTVIDVSGGLQDLKAGRIRRVNASSLADDPARLLRAVRFSVELGFPIEDATLDQMLRMAGAVQTVAPERRRDVLWKMLAGANPAGAIELLRTTGLLPIVLPEVAAMDLVQQGSPHDKDVYHHTLATMQFAAALRDWLLGRTQRVPLDADGAARVQVLTQALSTWAFYLRRHFAGAEAAGRLRAEWLVWHALLHDVGKTTTRSVEVGAEGVERVRFLGHEVVGAELARGRVTALRFSSAEAELVDAVAKNHMRPHLLHTSFPEIEISRRARYRFFHDIGPRGSDRPAGVDVLILALADLLATNAQLNPDAWRAYLVHAAQMFAFLYSEQAVERATHHPLVDGRTLMQELGMGPGPALGALLEQLAEAHAAGDVTTRAEALALARTLVQGSHL
jgi:poly(A) polymerase/tRNA nucleotidyltransferase (CCA-adding enzyme)